MHFFLLPIFLLLPAVGVSSLDDNIALSTQVQRGQSLASAVTDYGSLIKHFRALGLNVKPAGEVEQPFLSVTGKMIKLLGEDVQVFEYASTKEMEAEAAPISPDGSGVGARKIFWIGSPHFFKKEKLLVLYLGDNDKVLKALETALGRQFAGK